MKKRIPFKEANEKQIQGTLFTQAGHRISDFYRMQGLGYCGIIYPTGKSIDVTFKPAIVVWNEDGFPVFPTNEIDKLRLVVEYNAPDEVQWHLIYNNDGIIETPEMYGYPSEDHALGAWKRRLEEGNGNHIIGISKVKFTNTNK